jgi:hypothetical protein
VRFEYVARWTSKLAWTFCAREVSCHGYENGDDDDNNNNNKYEKGDVTVLWNQAVHTDREVRANRPDIILKTKKRKHAH